jgi:hypothetical protein
VGPPSAVGQIAPESAQGRPGSLRTRPPEVRFPAVGLTGSEPATPCPPAVGRGSALVGRSPSAQAERHTKRRRTLANQPEQGAMVVKMVVKNRRRDLPLCRSLVLVSPVAERDDVSEGPALERRPGERGAAVRRTAGCPRPGAGRDRGSACEDSAIRLELLPMTSRPSSSRRVNAHRPSEA